MDKPVIESHGLGLFKLKPKHIMPLYEDLSAENIAELREVYQVDPLEALLSLVGQQMIFVVERNGKALAITGLDDEGVMWALFTESMKKNWVRFARASIDLITFYHHFYDQLRCQVWSKNEMIVQWLAHLGFEPESIFMSGHIEMVEFVRCKSEKTNVYSFLSRPVMH
jgi:hypothetical protein